MLQLNARVLVFGGSKSANFDCLAIDETAKAIKFQDSGASFGHELCDFTVTFWLPISIIDKFIVYSQSDSFPDEIHLPYWFEIGMNKSKNN
jgi:hypothetical protein